MSYYITTIDNSDTIERIKDLHTLSPKYYHKIIGMKIKNDNWKQIVKFPYNDSFPSHLWNLEICCPKIKKISKLPEELLKFKCECNELTELCDLPDTLENFICTFGNLKFIPNLPEKIMLFECNYNKLIKLPELYHCNKLTEIICHNNNIIELPELPSGLVRLECSKNKLTKLPKLPVRLEILNCSHNNISDLPDLPICLRRLECNNNKNLTKLPDFLPSRIKFIDCGYTNINELPKNLPDNIGSLLLNNTPLIKLPKSILRTDLLYNHRKKYCNCFSNNLYIKNTYLEPLIIANAKKREFIYSNMGFYGKYHNKYDKTYSSFDEYECEVNYRYNPIKLYFDYLDELQARRKKTKY